MKTPEMPANELERLDALDQYSILDTLPEKDYDDITRLASEICATPVSMISLIDRDRQWFKSRFGINMEGSSRESSFCAHAINKPGEMMVVPDSRQDIRFVDNPFVTGETNLVFYAGVPLTNPEGFPLGTLCIIDNKPRALTASQKASLKALANMVVNLFELRKKNHELKISESKLREVNAELEKFAYVVSHDIKSPLNNIISTTELLRLGYAASLDEGGHEILDYLSRSSAQLKSFIDGVLAYYKGDQVLLKEKETIDLDKFLKGIAELLDGKHEFTFRYPLGQHSIRVNKSAIEQIFINLVGNAVKYNDKQQGIITFDFSEDDVFYNFSIADNGSGIAEEDLNKIFDVFVTLGKKDRFSNTGNGIGLSTVKKLVERLGGKMTVTSKLNQGSVFSFTLKK